MKSLFKTELPHVIITSLPFIYLLYVWNKLPDQVPLHWNAAGEVDRWGDKIELWIIPFLLPLLTYSILYFAPSIAPKNNLKKNEVRYNQIRLLLVSIMSIIAIYVIYSAQQLGDASPKMIFVLMGLLIAGLGNYMQTIKQNYFVGFRTPWTLESEDVWRATHRYAGRIWFAGGILITILTLLLSSMSTTITVFFFIIAIIVIIPSYYSYKLYKELKS